jgi:hypothetical protein
MRLAHSTSPDPHFVNELSVNCRIVTQARYVHQQTGRKLLLAAADWWLSSWFHCLESLSCGLHPPQVACESNPCLIR